MARPTKIKHPLLKRPGTSQRKRAVAAAALQPEYAPIDGRSLADILDYIHQYARQVLFYEQKKGVTGDLYIELSNWLPFFEDSLPFRLTRFSKMDFGKLERDVFALAAVAEQDPRPENISALLDFFFFELITPIDDLQKLARAHESDLRLYFEDAVHAQLLLPLRRYILLSNASNKYLCVGKRRFDHFTQAPWNILIEDIFSTDEFIAKVPGGRTGATLWLKDELVNVSLQALGALRHIARDTPQQLETALQALQGRHEPYLGLLFTFIRLFSHFQGDLNQLTQAHLDFFYQHVLRIKPRGQRPDKVHLLFELAKHLDSYLVEQGRAFKDGKDSNNIDIIFHLDEEVIIDKAEVKALKILHLNHTHSLNERNYVEGMYISPQAASADGIGRPFQEEQSKNWATLGAKPSKYTAPGKNTPEPHPFGRMGFVLASPVLWLNEGKRKITITINCDAGGNTDFGNDCFRKIEQIQNKTFYQITDRTIRKIENLFSPEAKAFLQEKLDESTPFFIRDLNEFFQSELFNGKQFTETEKTLITGLVSESDGAYILQEMPFASLVRYFTLLLMQQDPYPIGDDPDSFLTSQDLINCQPLIRDERVIKILEGLLDRDTQKNKLFQIQLSGEEGWFSPQKPPVVEVGSKLIFTIELDPDEPKVAFYDEEALQEGFKLDCPYPMAKIELNPKVQLECGNSVKNDPCCLKHAGQPDELLVGLYHFFRHLRVTDAKIEVEVCGVKNLIVQNEESLQDVNSLILPFGARPKVEAEFYIGSNEAFCKKWTAAHVNVTWKDRPVDLKKHYDEYGVGEEFEDGSNEITEESFKIKTATLEGGEWVQKEEKELFKDREFANFCDIANNDSISNSYKFEKTKTLLNSKLCQEPELLPLDVNTRDGFLRFVLKGVSFQHERYPFVLARNLIQLAGLIDPKDLPDLVKQISIIKTSLADASLPDNKDFEDIRGNLTYKFGVKKIINKINEKIGEIIGLSDPNDSIIGIINIVDGIDIDNVSSSVQNAIDNGDTSHLTGVPQALDDISQAISAIKQIVGSIPFLPIPINGTILFKINDLSILLGDLEELIEEIENKINAVSNYLPSEEKIENLGLPKEPYTPTIKSISIDYKAEAYINEITLIHLYPFEHTSKTEELTLQPTLLPTFTDEGTLFIGLENLRPGASLQLLFQFAEATADSESDRAAVRWHYLTGNRWQLLRTGFEIIADDTNRLTRSGIVKITLPRDISNIGNTVMPPEGSGGKHLHWLKVSAPTSVAAVAEVIGVHAQAALSTYRPLPGSAPYRSGRALDANKISKPLDPDFSIKKVAQPYESFGGQEPEAAGHLYTRVSEHLRHKGRSVDLFDFEHLVLEAFPELFKCKCINHTMSLSANHFWRDLEVAPGFIIVAVIPDLTKLKAGDMLEPKVPLSLLAEVKAFLRQRMSPFARVRVANPRYEKIKVEATVRLMPGRDENYYAAKLKTDLALFLAPWHLGDSDKISFGQPIVYSDVVGFIENLEYIDFIADLELFDSEGVKRSTEIQPLTARSILTGGEVCVNINRADCQEPITVENPKRGRDLLTKQSKVVVTGIPQSFIIKP